MIASEEKILNETSFLMKQSGIQESLSNHEISAVHPSELREGRNEKKKWQK
jgi:hypothetical protein